MQFCYEFIHSVCLIPNLSENETFVWAVGPISIFYIPVSSPFGSLIMADRVLKLAMPETTEPNLNLYFSMEGQLWM